jgi:DNA-binding transcriptional MerR regulator
MATKVPIYLSTSDASRVLGVAPVTVRLYADRGRLRVAATTESGQRLFARRDVEDLRKRRTLPKT